MRIIGNNGERKPTQEEEVIFEALEKEKAARLPTAEEQMQEQIDTLTLAMADLMYGGSSV